MGEDQGNLFTEAGGIFGTHVTWEDIEHDMQKALHTDAIFGPNKTISNIGDGNGFLSKICLIEPDWQNVEKDEKLPNKFIAKLCTAITMVAFSRRIAEEKGIPDLFNDQMCEVIQKLVRTFHNNEVHVYHLLDKYNVDKVPRAKIYHARKFSDTSLKGYLLMEFMENLSQVHIFNSVEPEDLDQALRGMAALGALSNRLTEEEMAGFSRKPLTEIFGKFFTEETMQSMGAFLSGFGGARLAEPIEKLVAVFPDFLDTEWPDAIPDHLNIGRVLCHGDLWSTNILWRDVDGKKVIAAVIDFQTAHLGNPAGDLSRLFTTNLTGATRMAHTDELLAKYYNYFKEELGGHTVPYTFEQLKEAYRRYQPTAGFLVVPMLGSLFESHLNKMNEEEKTRANDVLEEKMEHLIKEVLEMHERNKEIRKTQVK